MQYIRAKHKSTVLIQYLQFDPRVEHSSYYHVLLLNHGLEVCVEASAQGLVEVGVVGDEALQSLIKADEGRYDERKSHSISLQYLVKKKQKGNYLT